MALFSFILFTSKHEQMAESAHAQRNDAMNATQTTNEKNKQNPNIYKQTLRSTRSM